MNEALRRTVSALLLLSAVSGCRPSPTVEPMSGPLAGWTKIGGAATFAAEDGEIIGRARSFSDNTFLCTDERYGDFTLDVEFKAPSALNSGVQFRSDSRPDYEDGRVHGYQAEIDLDEERDRWWVAGVYDESRRGWLFPGAAGGDGAAFTEQGRKIARRGDWNHLRIEALGPRIRTWLNGTLRADFEDSMTSEGMICLQVHGGFWFPSGTEVRWRNLQIVPA